MPTPRVILYIACSLDGYIAAKDGDVSYLNPYSDALAGFADFQASIAASIMGRQTYEFVRQFAPPDASGQPTYVLTTRRLGDVPSGVRPFAGEPAALVARVRRDLQDAGSPGDIWLVGGGHTASAFHAAALIDLYRLFILPTTLGDGLRLFNPAVPATTRLTLTRTHTFPSGVVELVYEPRR